MKGLWNWLFPKPVSVSVRKGEKGRWRWFAASHEGVFLCECRASGYDTRDEAERHAKETLVPRRRVRVERH